MAVPKRKTSKGKRNQRSANKGLKAVNIVFDKETGEPKLPHHASFFDGKYKNVVVMKKFLKKERRAGKDEERAESE